MVSCWWRRRRWCSSGTCWADGDDNFIRVRVLCHRRDMDLDHYRENLRHVVRPDDPSEGEKSDRVLLEDWEALYLRQHLPVFAAYAADSAQEEEIALSYAEYIDMVVRDEGRTHVFVYAHTPAAKEVLYAVLDTMDDDHLSSGIEYKFDEFLYGNQQG